MTQKYDLVIAYRIYTGLSKVPPVFQHDKYKLAKLCLESLVQSLSGIRVKMYALLDNCPLEYEKLFTANFPKEDLEIIRLDSYGNKKSFKKQIEILSTQNDADIVYFAEDDYFYIENIHSMIELLQSGKADFVTPYEHPSCYTDDHVLNLKHINNNHKEFVTVQHACLTFMTTKKTLLKNRRYLRIFSDWFGSDFVVWGTITLGWNFFSYFHYMFDGKKYSIETAKVFGSMLVFAFHRFISNTSYILCMPTPTIATHMESNFLSPNIDWDSYFKDLM